MTGAPAAFAAIFAALFAAHQVGDHWVQTHHQAMVKSAAGWAGRLLEQRKGRRAMTERRCRCGHFFGQHEIRAGGLFGCYITGCPCIDFTGTGPAAGAGGSP